MPEVRLNRSERTAFLRPGLLLTALLAACVTEPAPPLPGPETRLAQLTHGMHKREVFELLGQPAAVLAAGQEAWMYPVPDLRLDSGEKVGVPGELNFTLYFVESRLQWQGKPLTPVDLTALRVGMPQDEMNTLLGRPLTTAERGQGQDPFQARAYPRRDGKPGDILWVCLTMDPKTRTLATWSRATP